jgi:hypothetical protein
MIGPFAGVFAERTPSLISAARLDFCRPLRAALATLALAQLAAGAAASQVTSPQFPGVTCEEVRVPMRDGTLLTTDVYLPTAPGRYPVVMQRDPYGRLLGNGCFVGLSSSVATFAQQGYVGIDQQVRGTYTSQGSFTPIFQEAKDGYDAVEWAGVQPWSTGKVGMTSGSYLGIVQWQAAPLRPPHLAAIAPSVMDSDYHDGNAYVNGVFSLWLSQSWPAGAIIPDQMFRAGQSSAQVDAWNTLVNENLLTSWVWQLPLSGFSEFRQFASFYYDWVGHPNYDAYWAKVDTSTRYPDIIVPALVSGDWYDPFQVGTVQNFQGMRSVGGSAQARQGTRLVMGAYGHSGDSGTPTFGDDTPDPSIQMRFYDHYLKGLDNGFEDDPIVHLYVLVPPNSGDTGSGFWITGNDFPLPGTRIAKYFLHSGGHANTRLGDGMLRGDDGGRDERARATADHARATADHFDYDPENPVPTVGGNMCCNGVLLPAGALDQSTVELRNDVLVYTGAPLAHDMAVIGTVNATFWAMTSARDTDFTLKLVDVHPDGLTHNVLDRIVRARFREGSRLPPELVEPNQPYQYTLELGNTATIFRAGHQIRVEVSSSSFPHYARNLNTGLDNNSTDAVLVAHQTILHDNDHASFIALPIAPHVAIP